MRVHLAITCSIAEGQRVKHYMIEQDPDGQYQV